MEVSGLRKKYGKKEILKDISFRIECGEQVAVVGKNGCGKSTLMRIMAGILKPDAGQIRYFGQDALKMKGNLRKYCGYVPQENPLIPELTARDNYRLWFKGDKAELERDLEEGVGKFLGLTEFLGTPAGKLSGGQKKRLSIASALSNQASLLIMDEPGAALDLEAKEEILTYIRNYLKNGGTVILTSHETQELSICTQLFVMKKGLLMPVTEKLSAAELVLLF